MTKFKQLQESTGLTNEQTAEYLDIGISSVKRYKSGERDAPKWVLLAMMDKVERTGPCTKCGKPATTKCSKTPSGGWGSIKCGKVVTH